MAFIDKLDTICKLADHRLTLQMKKKVEMGSRARKEIADMIAINKIESARIKTELLIQDDYLLEAFEIIQGYIRMIKARRGLIATQKNIDSGLSEPLITLIWASNRLCTDVPELENLRKLLKVKYGETFYKTSLSNTLHLASPKIVNNLSVHPPSCEMIENYLQEIASAHNLSYTPQYPKFKEKMSMLENQLMEEQSSFSSLISFTSLQSLNQSFASAVDKSDSPNCKSFYSDESKTSCEHKDSPNRNLIKHKNFASLPDVPPFNYDSLYMTPEKQKEDFMDLNKNYENRNSLDIEALSKPESPRSQLPNLKTKSSNLIFDEVEEQSRAKPPEFEDLEELFKNYRPN